MGLHPHGPALSCASTFLRLHFLRLRPLPQIASIGPLAQSRPVAIKDITSEISPPSDRRG
jgi:hypothetical protein